MSNVTTHCPGTTLHFDVLLFVRMTGMVHPVSRVGFPLVP